MKLRYSYLDELYRSGIRFKVTFMDREFELRPDEVEKYTIEPTIFMIDKLNLDVNKVIAYLDYRDGGYKCSGLNKSGNKCNKPISNKNVEFNDFIMGITDRCHLHQDTLINDLF